MAYKEAKPLSHNLSEEDSRYHKTHKHIPDIEVLTWASLSNIYTILMQLKLRWACLHKRSLPPEETALWKTVSGQALPRRPEKVLQRHTEGLHEIFWYCSSCLKYLAQDRDKWHEVIRRGTKVWGTRRNTATEPAGNLEKVLLHQPLPLPFLVLTAQDFFIHRLVSLTICALTDAFLNHKVD